MNSAKLPCLEDVDMFKYLGSMCVANGQGTEEIRSRINLDAGSSRTGGMLPPVQVKLTN